MAGGLLTADQVSERLGVDRSTVYRMAMDGRLDAVKVGRQWRFPVAAISERFGGEAPPGEAGGGPRLVPLGDAVQAVLDAAAVALGVMLVVTDMDGTPVSDVANPCPWFVEHGDEPGVLDSCQVLWRAMADDHDLVPRLTPGAHDFECARALVRDGDRLVAMVLAGGVAPADLDPTSARAAGLHHLDEAQRAHLVRTLPRIAVAIASLSTSARSTS